MPVVQVSVPGLRGPCAATPSRVPGSARRTSHVDVVRDAVWDGRVVVTAVARDLVTPADGARPTTKECRLRVVAEGRGASVTEIHSDPPEPALDGLRASPLLTGFRRAVAAALPDAPRAMSLLHRLLDDVPLAYLVSGHAAMLGTADVPAESQGRIAGSMADVCAGWQQGGVLLRLVEETGTVPHSLGPPAPPLGTEPGSWHDRPPLPARATRRSRRLDVIADDRTGPVHLDCHFRDSYADLDGVERSLHEYTLDADADPVTGVLVRAAATPRALPWTECPEAADSAARTIGLRLDDLHDLVRRQFTGISTCTHLNDTLRSLADASDLLRSLATHR